MSSPILVTGATGFVGRHLIAHLLEHGDGPIVGLGQGQGELDDRVDHVELDLTDGDATRAAIQRIRPGLVYHLAARSSVGESLQDPLQTLSDNLVLQVNVLATLVELGTLPRVLVIGSSEQYGLVRPDERPLPESAEFRPLNPYAVSKVTQDLLGYQYFRAHGLPVVRARPFTHIGPGQQARFVTPSFARQIALIEAGFQAPVLSVGNLEAERDLTDVRDIVRGYRLLLQLGEAGEAYNLGSGRLVSIQSVLDRLLAQSSASVRVARDPGRYRPVDTPPQLADCRKIERQTGWRPRIGLDKSLGDILDYWRDRVSRLGSGA